MVVGFAGKDIEKTMEHIHELEEAGIKCPRKVPVLYQCEKQILTEKDEIEVIGNKTSGEVEYLILIKNGKIYIGVGSDHTDRELEAVSIHKSKQVCLKPYAKDFWEYDEIKDHLMKLNLFPARLLTEKPLNTSVA